MPQIGMTRRHVVAGLAGAALAAAGLFLGGGFEESTAVVDDAPEVTATTSAAAPFVAAGETLIGNTAFVPLEVRSVGSAVALDYALTGLGGGELTSVPERFVLTDSNGNEYTGSVSSDLTRQVRFEGAGNTVVAEIAVTQWRLRTYEYYETELSLTDGVTLTDGTELTIDRVLDETVGGLVYFNVTPGDNRGFGRDFTGPLIIASGDGWQDTLNVSHGGSSVGTPSLSVTVEPIPDSIPVQVFALPWVLMEDRTVVYRIGDAS